MSTIVKFPIVVLTDTASETDIGVTPVLKTGLVSATDDERSKAVLSERGIRNAINDLTFKIAGENYPTSGVTGIVSGGNYMPFYDSTQYNSTSADVAQIMKFNTITATGILSAEARENEVYIHTLQLDDPNEESSSGISKYRSINGGIYQEASIARYNMGDKKKIFYKPKVGDVIGKILIKLKKEFNDDTTMFSIGSEYEKELYIKKFKPSKTAEGDLVDFRYGAGMMDKVEIINTPKNLRNIRVLFLEEKITGSDSVFSLNDFTSYTSNEFESKIDLTTKYAGSVTTLDIENADLIIAQSFKLPANESVTLPTAVLDMIAYKINRNKLSLMLLHADGANTIPKQIFDMNNRPWDGNLHINAITETEAYTNLINSVDITQINNMITQIYQSNKLGYIDSYTNIISLAIDNSFSKTILAYYNGSPDGNGNMLICTSDKINTDNNASKILENYVTKITTSNQSKFYQIGL